MAVQTTAGRGRARRPGARTLAGGLALIAVLAAAAASRGETGAGLLKVRLGGDPERARVVLELDRAVRGEAAEPASADRLSLRLPHVATAGDMAGPGQGLVRGWRVAGRGGAAVLSLELARPGVVRRRFLLPPGDGVLVYRYVIDVEAQGQPQLQRAALRRRPPVPATGPEPAPPALDAGPRVIVIDAGHGGKDPGAQGLFAHEKDITLAAARGLKARLERTGRYRVVLTRSGDVFVPLEERVRLARRANADLFISLHADADADPLVRGATVYTLSDKTADHVQRKLTGGGDWIMSVRLPARDEQVNRILLDLTQRETKNRSSIFAESLLDRVSEEAPLLRRSHRDAGFVVLLAPDVPAVLMEMGFITNAGDERALADPARRGRLMQAVGDAIDAYFARASAPQIAMR